jgi:hypothetical protein
MRSVRPAHDMVVFPFQPLRQGDELPQGGLPDQCSMEPALAPSNAHAMAITAVLLDRRESPGNPLK